MVDKSMGTVEALVKAKLERKEQDEAVIEKAEEWKECVNRILSTPDGQLLARYLIKYCGLFKADNANNQIQLIENNSKRKLWLDLFQPYINKSILLEILSK